MWNIKIPVKLILKRAKLLASWFGLGVCSSGSMLREIFLHSFIFMPIYIYLAQSMNQGHRITLYPIIFFGGAERVICTKYDFGNP